MTIRFVYLAGGINGLSDADANDWRTEAKTRLAEHQILSVDPMDRDYRGKEDTNIPEIVATDIRDIRASQAIIANCPRPSWGTAMEVHWSHTFPRYALPGHYYTDYGEGPIQNHGYRKTVAVVPEGVPVSPWLRFHTDAIVNTVEAAVAQVVEWSK